MSAYILEGLLSNLKIKGSKMKKILKNLGVTLATASILISSYAFAKPPTSTCQEVCTIFCAFLGACVNS